MSCHFTTEKNSRRNFLKLSGLSILGSLIAAKIMGQSTPALAADAPLVMVKESDPMAQSLGYNENATKVDTKKWSKRAGPGGAKQFCYSCQFFQAKGDPKAAKTAACTIFGGKGVNAKGWCNTWTQNPAVKG